MCTIIVTIRSVLWAVMTIVGTLMILVALFTNRWLHGQETGKFDSVSAFENGLKNIGNNLETLVKDGGSVADVLSKNIGIFLDCKEILGQQVFAGECIPDLNMLVNDFRSQDDSDYPHAWKAGIGCFILGLAIMVVTVLLSLCTPCCRSCVCCSVFTICGSFQFFASVFFTLGLVAFPAGWGSERVVDLCVDSQPFLAGHCQIGGAYWMAVAGTVCSYLASVLAVFAYKSTVSVKALNREAVGDRFICVP